MANETAIGWTDLSWNPVHGCDKVSPGCAHCYAETLSLQRGHTSKPWTPENAAENVLLKPHKLKEPFSGAKVWRGLGEAAARAGKTDGKLVFVNSMSDLFHEQVPGEFIAQVFATMAVASKHSFQVLTKRPETMREIVGDEEFRHRVFCLAHDRLEARLSGAELDAWRDDPNAADLTDHLEWPLANVWLGVSIENRRYIDRADVLRDTPAAVRFISAEPLLGPLLPDAPYMEDAEHEQWPLGDADFRCWRPWADGYQGRGLSLEQIDWLIVGGESGPAHRPMDLDWVRELRDHCQDECWQGEREGSTALFYKQFGGAKPTSGGRELDGRTWDEFPQVREAVVA